jgi:MarR family transcriptional regulator for hemolysin
MPKIVDEAAHQILESVPVVMRMIRTEFRGQRSSDLSVAQFRTLAYIKNNDGASLSNLAAHIGLTLPSMSKLIDGLVSRKFVARNSHQEDRRKICLQLTSTGRSELEAAYDHTQMFLVDTLSGLAKEDLNTVSRSMQILKDLFMSEQPSLKIKK